MRSIQPSILAAKLWLLHQIDRLSLAATIALIVVIGIPVVIIIAIMSLPHQLISAAKDRRRFSRPSP